MSKRIGVNLLLAKGEQNLNRICKPGAPKHMSTRIGVKLLVAERGRNKRGTLSHYGVPRVRAVSFPLRSFSA